MKLSQQLLRFDISLSVPLRRQLTTAVATDIKTNRPPSRRRQSMPGNQQQSKSQQLTKFKKEVREISTPPSIEALRSAVQRQSVSLVLKELISVSMYPGPHVRIARNAKERYGLMAAELLSNMSSIKIHQPGHTPSSSTLKNIEETFTEKKQLNTPSSSLPSSTKSTLNKEIIKLMCKSASELELETFRNILKTRCIFRMPWERAVPAMAPATDLPLLLFELDVDDINKIIRACIHVKSIREAVDWLLFMYEVPTVGRNARPLRPNKETFELLIPAAAKRLDWSDLFLVLNNARLLSNSEDHFVSPRQYDVLIRRCLENSHSRWQHAIRFYTEYMNAHPTSFDSNLSAVVIKVLLKANKYKEAEEFILSHNLLETQPPSSESSLSSKMPNTLTKELFIEISRVLIHRSREQDMMRLVGHFLTVNNFTTPSTRPSVSKAMLDIMDELSASVDVGINSSDTLFTAAVIASCNDAYNLLSNEPSISDSIEALWTSLARSSSVNGNVATEALQVLCRLIADRIKYDTSVPPALVQTVKNLSLTTHANPVVIAASTPISTLPDLISILSLSEDDLNVAMEAYRHLSEQGKLLDKTIYRKLVTALSRAGKHQDVLEMFDWYLRLSDEILAHHRDANIIKQQGIPKKNATKITKVYHPGTRSIVKIKDTVEINDAVFVQPKETTKDTEDTEDDKPLPMAAVDPEIIHSVIPSLAQMGEVDVIISLLLEEMPSRGIYPHVPSTIMLLQIMFNNGRYIDAIEIFTKFWSDSILKTPKRKSGKKFANKWKISNSEIEALVDISLKCCKEAGNARNALEIMVLWEKLTSHSNALDVTGSSWDFRSRWYTMVSETLAKDKESFAMLPSFINSLKDSATVPSRALLTTCIDLCKQIGDEVMEKQMRELMVECGH